MFVCIHACVFMHLSMYVSAKPCGLAGGKIRARTVVVLALPKLVRRTGLPINVSFRVYKEQFATIMSVLS